MINIVINGITTTYLDTSDTAHQTKSRSVLVFASGQSNMARYETLTWSPPPNVRLWNHNPMLDLPTHVGTAFEPMPSDRISLSWSFAAEIARENPDKTVYVVNTSRGGQPIANWLPGGSLDLYACGKNNIEAALAVIAEPVKLVHLWWQGEYDASVGNVNYVSDFLSYRARLGEETWWSRENPILIFGLSSYMAGAEGEKQRAFNGCLAQIAALDPERFRYIHSSTLGQAFAWSPTNGADSYIHMTAAGYRAAGAMAYNVLYGGFGRGTIDTAFVDPGTKQFMQPGKYAFSATKGGSGVPVGDVSDYIADYNTIGASFNLTTGVLTIPISGLWCFENVLNSNNAACTVHLFRNGANIGMASAMNVPAGLGNVTSQSTTTALLNKGDQIKLVVAAGSSPANAVRFAGRLVG